MIRSKDEAQKILISSHKGISRVFFVEKRQSENHGSYYRFITWHKGDRPDFALIGSVFEETGFVGISSAPLTDDKDCPLSNYYKELLGMTLEEMYEAATRREKAA